MLLDNKLKHYKHYENLMKLGPEQPIIETLDYHRFFEVYPNIAESIRLKRKLAQLTKELKSEKRQGTKFQIKQKIRVTKSELKKNSLRKRLHGDCKQEKIFSKKFKHKTSKKRHSQVKKKIGNKIGQPLGAFSLRVRRSMHKNLPPTLFNLGEHDVSEKGLALKEWLHEKRDELSKVLD